MNAQDLKLTPAEIRLLQVYRRMCAEDKRFIGALSDSLVAQIPAPRVLRLVSGGRSA